MKFFRKHVIFKPDKTQLSLSLLLIASPWMLLFITTRIIAHHSVFNSVPCWSDELAYWHEILSFSQKGFGFGYYTINEVLPKYLSFGTHGFGTVSVYALFGKIFGWKTYSIVIANALFISLSIAILLLLVRITSRNLLLILAFTLTYIPLILFSPTSMTELLNYSVLITYMALLYNYFHREGKKWLVFLLLFCTAISFIRIIYVILLLPLLFKRKNQFRFDGKFIISLFLWVVFSSLLFIVNNLVVSPYPDSFLNELFKCSSFIDFMSGFSIHFVQNTWYLINPFSENSVQVLHRYFVIAICLLCLWKSNMLQSKFKKIEIDYFIVFLMLFLFLLITVAAYDVFDWRDYRVLAPVLYGCILYLILNNKEKLAYGFLSFNVIGILFLIISPQVLESFNKDRYSKPLEIPILNQLEYTVRAHSGFENTIVLHEFNTNSVLNIPAGIGITYSDSLSDSLKSKYIFSEKQLNLQTYQLINSNKTGYLYVKHLTSSN